MTTSEDRQTQTLPAGDGGVVTQTFPAPTDEAERGAPGRTPASGTLPLLAAGVTVVLWASAFIGIRVSGHDYSPGALALGRLLAGTAALTVMAAVSGRLRVPRGRPLLLVVVWGVAWFGGYNVTLNAAEQHLDAGTAALLVNTAPILVAVLAAAFLGEGFPRRLLIGMAVAFAGVATIAITTSTGLHDGVGVALGLLSAVLYAAGVIIQKKALPHVDALTMTWLGCVAGTVACLPFAPALVPEAAAAPVDATLGLVYLGIFPTAIAFSTWGWALARTSAGRLTASTYLVPPLVVGMSWAMLGEAPGPVTLVGGALSLAGVLVATLRWPSR